MNAADNFDASREPMRAIRDLICDCECGAFNEGNPEVLRRAQDALTSLRSWFGDTRPAEDIAFAKMREPDLEVLQLTTGALVAIIANQLPASEGDMVRFTGKWERFGALSLSTILDRANAALEPVAEKSS